MKNPVTRSVRKTNIPAVLADGKDGVLMARFCKRGQSKPRFVLPDTADDGQTA